MSLRHFLKFLVLLGGFVGTFSSGVIAATVSLGIDQLEKSNFSVLEGKRVGLVTNPSGIDSKGRSAITVLYQGQGSGKGYKLLKLFGPEHGIDGQTGAGKDVKDGRDRATRLPVFSLYGDTRRPTPKMLAGLDAMVYDVQDLGNRSYTFISTLGYVMEECAKYNIEVIVLDRPNPLGGVRIEGPCLDPNVKSFVGLYDIPYVYGLTPGELAQWINAKYLAKPCRLTVVAMRGWTRKMVWEDTGLRWVPTSPYIPTIGAVRGYTATGIIGEIGIETGLGTPYPFEAIAGSGWDAKGFAKRFNALRIPGVVGVPYTYRAGGTYNGIYLKMDPRNAGNLTAINFQALEILRKTVSGFAPFARNSSDQIDMFKKVTGLAQLRSQLINGRPVVDIVRSWDSGVVHWAEERLPYLLYGNTPVRTEAAPPAASVSPPSTIAVTSEALP